MAALNNCEPTLGMRELSEEEKQRANQNMIVVGLLTVGILLVGCAEWLGQQSVMYCGSGGGCAWSTENAHAAADTFRCFGIMAFVAGVAERIILIVKAQRSPMS